MDSFTNWDAGRMGIMGTMDIVGIVGRAADALGRLDIMGFDEFQ